MANLVLFATIKLSPLYQQARFVIEVEKLTKLSSRIFLAVDVKYISKAENAVGLKCW